MAFLFLVGKTGGDSLPMIKNREAGQIGDNITEILFQNGYDTNTKIKRRYFK